MRCVIYAAGERSMIVDLFILTATWKLDLGAEMTASILWSSTPYPCILLGYYPTDQRLVFMRSWPSHPRSQHGFSETSSNQNFGSIEQRKQTVASYIGRGAKTEEEAPAP